MIGSFGKRGLFGRLVADFLGTLAPGDVEVKANKNQASGYAGLDSSSLQVKAQHSVYVLAQSGITVTAPSDTTEDILATISIPAGAVGPNGRIKLTTYWQMTNNANAKTFRARLGGISGSAYLAYSAASLATAKLQVDILANNNSTSSQIGGIYATGGFGGGPYAPVTSSLDMTQAQTLVITSQKSTAGDTVNLIGYTVEVLNP